MWLRVNQGSCRLHELSIVNSDRLPSRTVTVHVDSGGLVNNQQLTVTDSDYLWSQWPLLKGGAGGYTRTIALMLQHWPSWPSRVTFVHVRDFISFFAFRLREYDQNLHAHTHKEFAIAI